MYWSISCILDHVYATKSKYQMSTSLHCFGYIIHQADVKLNITQESHAACIAIRLLALKINVLMYSGIATWLVSNIIITIIIIY